MAFNGSFFSSSFGFMDSLTRPANFIASRIYSSVLLIKFMTSFAMSCCSSFNIAIFLSSMFCFALSANSASILGYVCIFVCILMSMLAISSFLARVSFIFSLFKNCSPSAIFRAIIFIVINPIDLMFRSRFVAHIFYKIIKAIKPAVTYFNTSSAIIFIMRVFRVITTFYHVITGLIKYISWCFHGCYNRQKIKRSQHYGWV